MLGTTCRVAFIPWPCLLYGLCYSSALPFGAMWTFIEIQLLGGGIKAGGSRLMLCSLMFMVVFSVGWTDEDTFCSHGWLLMSSREGRSAGRTDRHHLIRCWHSGRAEEHLVSTDPRTRCIISFMTKKTLKFPSIQSYLWRFSFGKGPDLLWSPRRVQRECPHTPCHTTKCPGTTQWQSARGTDGVWSTPGGCILVSLLGEINRFH